VGYDDTLKGLAVLGGLAGFASPPARWPAAALCGQCPHWLRTFGAPSLSSGVYDDDARDRHGSAVLWCERDRHCQRQAPVAA
jgi:hypothetical protein